MVFPLYIFLIIYFALLLGWLIFSLIGVYHLLKFGFLNFTTFFSIFIYIVVSFFLLSVSYDYLSQIDWKTNVSVFGNIINISF